MGVPNPINSYYDLLLRTPAAQPLPTGPLPHALAQGALFASLGYGSGVLTKADAKKKRNRALIGGALGLALGLPGVLTTANLAKSDSYKHLGVDSTAKALVNPVGRGELDARLVPPYGTDTPGEMPKQSSAFSDVENYPSDQLTVGQSLDTILADTSLDPLSKAQGALLIRSAARRQPSGLFGTRDLISAGVSLGLGYGAGAAVGKTLGAVFSMPAKTQKRMAQFGAVGALLKATGAWN